MSSICLICEGTKSENEAKGGGGGAKERKEGQYKIQA